MFFYPMSFNLVIRSTDKTMAVSGVVMEMVAKFNRRNTHVPPAFAPCLAPQVSHNDNEKDSFEKKTSLHVAAEVRFTSLLSSHKLLSVLITMVLLN
jgi:hypothetical protein